MNPESLLSACNRAGVSLRIEGNALKAYGHEDSVRLLLPHLKEHREALKVYVAGDESEFYEERAAIAEYDGGLNRTDAEHQARSELQTLNSNKQIH